MANATEQARDHEAGMRVGKTRNLRTKFGYVLQSLACVNSEHHKRYMQHPRPLLDYALPWLGVLRHLKPGVLLLLTYDAHLDPSYLRSTTCDILYNAT